MIDLSSIDTIVSLKEAGGMSYDPDNNSLTLYGQINDLVLTKELIETKTNKLWLTFTKMSFITMFLK